MASPPDPVTWLGDRGQVATPLEFLRLAKEGIQSDSLIFFFKSSAFLLLVSM